MSVIMDWVWRWLNPRKMSVYRISGNEVIEETILVQDFTPPDHPFYPVQVGPYTVWHDSTQYDRKHKLTIEDRDFYGTIVVTKWINGQYGEFEWYWDNKPQVYSCYLASLRMMVFNTSREWLIPPVLTESETPHSSMYPRKARWTHLVVTLLFFLGSNKRTM